MILCPCCNRPMEADKAPVAALTAAPVWGQHKTILDALASAYPRYVEQSFLIDLLYSNDPDGGPICANNIVRSRVVGLRKTIREYGWTIGKYTTGRYRLEPIEGAQ